MKPPWEEERFFGRSLSNYHSPETFYFLVSLFLLLTVYSVPFVVDQQTKDQTFIRGTVFMALGLITMIVGFMMVMCDRVYHDGVESDATRRLMTEDYEMTVVSFTPGDRIDESYTSKRRDNND